MNYKEIAKLTEQGEPGGIVDVWPDGSATLRVGSTRCGQPNDKGGFDWPCIELRAYEHDEESVKEKILDYIHEWRINSIRHYDTGGSEEELRHDEERLRIFVKETIGS